MMKHPHFRLKVNLSKFFHDARQYCWVFVDGTKIQQVMHLNQHISKLFNITESFHLLLNDTEYLPPAEDVRLLENNETILVVPGSGINNDTVIHNMESPNDSLNDKEVQICDIKKKDVRNKLDVTDNILNNTQRTSINNTRDVTFYSVIDEDVDNATLDDTEQDTDSKVTDNNFAEDCNGIKSVISAKRKRVRKRKPKNRSSLVSPSDTKEENTSKKPKIIDSYIIPTAKHIRFDDIESKENNIAKNIVQETSTSNESYASRASPTKDLSMLLSLRQSSTPITFINRKMKVNTASNNGINKNLNKIIEKDNLENKLCNEEANKKLQCSQNFTVEKLAIEKLPILVGEKPRVKDVIAFKTLKIAADYTPQLSNFIVTEILDFCEKTANYTLKILHGREEVRVPFGKFSLSDDESVGQSDTDTDRFILNYSQMKEIRLIPYWGSFI